MSDWPVNGRRLQGSGMLVMPANASGVTLTSGGGAWTKGSYTQVLASTAEAEYIIGVLLYAPNYRDTGYEIDIATGGGGSESNISTVVHNSGTTYESGSDGPIRLSVYIPFIAPVAVAASTRISARCSDSVGSKTIVIKIVYCKQSDLVVM